MALPAFKNGQPLFKNGLPCFGCGTCGGCACGTVTAIGNQCSVCPSLCTPAQIEAVLSGIATACYTIPSVADVDANGATLAGTFVSVKAGSGCQWVFSENPGTSFNFRRFGSAGCTGTVQNNRAWNLIINLRDPGGGAALKVRARLELGLGVAPDTTVFFDGEADMPSACSGTVVINNGDGGLSTHGGTGGTITLHFCP